MSYDPIASQRVEANRGAKIVLYLVARCLGFAVLMGHRPDANQADTGRVAI
ncbi:hypothetical protein GNZ13_41930 [Paraburkholderia sp. 5N]|uniref:Uncharacterized protein n=1 Tax=Paraburkholderia elongata TaxID=2675747 RepID=A0A972NYV1_9BURK|nr:hypothetical protein [Paraburkholderia elongata]NPT60934.1 hypothetical protein [Paraburkholderia elongata]